MHRRHCNPASRYRSGLNKIMQTDSHPAGQSTLLENNAPTCHPAPKWMALVDDVPVPVPQRRVKVSVIRSQAGLPCDFALIRDHNSPEDPILEDDELIDLAEGNVFNRISILDAEPRHGCTEMPKLAYFIDDRPELTTNPRQTGHTLRELFGLAPDTLLIRDFESPRDESIPPAHTTHFADGPVFYTRRRHHTVLSITVNSRQFTESEGVKAEMTGEEIASLVYPQAPRETRVWQRDHGRDREIRLTEVVNIRGCEVFDVVRRKVDGGYELARIEREVDLLNGTGTQVKLIVLPTPAVIYTALRTQPGNPVKSTDVLVPVPAGYPGQFIDWAYLPEGSPLIGRVAGSPQGHVIQADRRAWRQISYHPHNGGGGPPWDPTAYGFHTYVTELVAWLYNAR